MNVAVIGGGASGFFFAVNAARLYPNANITIYEQSEKVLQKVRISGGGRCNVTHHCFDAATLVKRYPRGEKELRSLFHRFQPQDTVNWFQERGLALNAEADGRMFPETNRSESVLQLLQAEAHQYGVKVALKMGLSHITPHITPSFTLHFKNGEVRSADKVVIACGGFPDVKKYDFIRSLGHKVVPPVPSLFTFNVKDKNLHQLAGISFQGSIKIEKRKYEGAMLITHWGLSGPAILRASAVEARTLNDCAYQFSVVLSWILASEESVLAAFTALKQDVPKKKVVNVPILNISQRLWAYLSNLANINPERLVGDLSQKEIRAYANILLATPFSINGKSTFKEEFVTAGGVDLKSVDLRTMQSKLVPNLYFVGEILNVDGITGGYNFQHAWSSAFVAATALES
jgi:predicted Rossmann fold flavoprotein